MANKSMNKSGVSSFAFTYKKNYARGADMLESDYDPVLNVISNNEGIVTHHCFERSGKYNQLHVHGIALLAKNVRYKWLTVKGFSSKWEEIYDHAGWLRYIRKDQKYREQIQFETMNHPPPPVDEADTDSIEDPPCKMPTRKLF